MSSADLGAATILPCFDEEETLQTVVEKAFVGGSKTGKAFTFIKAGKGSTDESIDIALKFEARIISVKNKALC